MNDQLKSMYETLTPEEWNEFVYYSSNVRHVLQQQDISLVIDSYQELRNYVVKQSTLDLRAGVDPAEADSSFCESFQGTTQLFVTFHYGSYRTIPLRLLAQGISVAVLLSAEIFEEYKAYYQSILGSSAKDIGCLMHATSRGRMYLLKAEDPQLIFKIKKMKTFGIHLFVYADGGRGLNPVAQQAKLQTVTFLNAKLQVRAGFLDIAYLLEMPVRFVLEQSEKLNEPTEILCLSCYKRDLFRSRLEFVQSTIQDIYERFAKELLRKSFMWEAWFYIHVHSIPHSDVLTWGKAERLFPIFLGDNAGMIDRFTYRIHPLSEKEYGRLMKYFL